MNLFCRLRLITESERHERHHSHLPTAAGEVMGESAWNAGRMLYALARYFDWWQNRMMTEVVIDGGRADLVFMTKAMYLTEVEIKISLSDWNADRSKDKFKKPRPHVARFFYAIPETLQSRIPAWLPEGAGILVVYEQNRWADGVREFRAGRRYAGAQKVPPLLFDQWRDAAYYRFWRSEMSRLAQRKWKRVDVDSAAA